MNIPNWANVWKIANRIVTGVLQADFRRDFSAAVAQIHVISAYGIYLWSGTENSQIRRLLRFC